MNLSLADSSRAKIARANVGEAHAPASPIFYQATSYGTSLVDPDNRRPNDFTCGSGCWPNLRNATVEQCDEAFRRGMPSCGLSAMASRCASGIRSGSARRQDRALEARGSRRDHVVAFIRGESVVTICAAAGSRSMATIGATPKWNYHAAIWAII